MTYNGYVADLFFNACAIVMWAAFLWRVLDGPRFSWWGTALLTLVIGAAYLLPVLLLEPVLLPVLALIFLVCLVPTGMVSLGSITMASAYPVLTLVYSLMRGLPTQDVVVCTVGAAIMGGMVIWMHRTNIQRIRDGKEYRFGQKHKSN